VNSDSHTHCKDLTKEEHACIKATEEIFEDCGTQRSRRGSAADASRTETAIAYKAREI